MPPSPKTANLLMEIARCPHVAPCLEGKTPSHPCAGIVGLQKATLDEHQVPEPWSGDLERARILFLGSNPGISYVEDYPRWSWPDDLIVDFFARRFGGGQKEWVRDGRHILLHDGTHSRDWVRYWAAVHGRAEELLGKGRAVPGQDYVLSEVVHCKSRHEVGVAEALEACAPHYLERLVAHTPAHVVVGLGRFPEIAIRRTFALSRSDRVVGPIAINGIDRYFAFLPHPSAFEPKTFGSLQPENLALLRAAV